MSITIEGEKEYYTAIERLVKSVKPDKIEPVTFKAAQIVTRASKEEVPIRKRQGSPKRKPPGQLKKGIKTKKLRRSFFGGAAPSISAVDWKTSPHMYLVHHGTGERIGKRGYTPYRGKRFGRMKGDPFHERAWNRKRGDVLAYIEKNVKKFIDEAVR